MPWDLNEKQKTLNYRNHTPIPIPIPSTEMSSCGMLSHSVMSDSLEPHGL